MTRSEIKFPIKRWLLFSLDEKQPHVQVVVIHFYKRFWTKLIIFPIHSMQRNRRKMKRKQDEKFIYVYKLILLTLNAEVNPFRHRY